MAHPTRWITCFCYPLGAMVHWSGSPDGAQPWEITARRYTEGTVSNYIEYLLMGHGTVRWAYEPDLEEVPHAPR